MKLARQPVIGQLLSMKLAGRLPTFDMILNGGPSRS